jgi:hypothetical protein
VGATKRKHIDDLSMAELRAMPPAEIAERLREASSRWIAYTHGEDHLMYFAAEAIDHLLKSRA